MAPSRSLPYDHTDPAEIEKYARRLIGHTFREMLDDPGSVKAQSGKGRFGDILEKAYFGIDGGNRPTPDFEEAGVELKATPVVRRGKTRLAAKERLVLGMISYDKVTAKPWGECSFLNKNRNILLVQYLWEPGVSDLDYTILSARLWQFPEEDLEVIRNDWETIVDKVRRGQAHTLSERDTNYLAATVKGAKGTDRRSQPYSTEEAKPRAFSLKQSYMNVVVERTLQRSLESFATVSELRAHKTIESLVHERFARYIGLTADEIGERLGVDIKRGAKNFYAVLTRRILGVSADKKIEEFEKADIQVKTVRLKSNGVPKEDISFKAFDYAALVQQEWPESDFRADLAKRFLFVIYTIDSAGVPTLDRTQFWSMPLSDVESYGRTCFLETVSRVNEDRAEYLPKKSENLACHVRPHGRDSQDKIITPTGRYVVRKSFWLNGSYLARQLTRREDS